MPLKKQAASVPFCFGELMVVGSLNTGYETLVPKGQPLTKVQFVACLKLLVEVNKWMYLVGKNIFPSHFALDSVKGSLACVFVFCCLFVCFSFNKRGRVGMIPQKPCEWQNSYLFCSFFEKAKCTCIFFYPSDDVEEFQTMNIFPGLHRTLTDSFCKRNRVWDGTKPKNPQKI